MAFTYNLATSVGQIRLLIADTDYASYDFEDAELAFFLTSEGTVKGAAAMAFETLAGNRSRLAVRVQRGPVSEDLTQVAASLRQQAALLRQQAADSDEGAPLQAIISPSYERFSRQTNEYLERRTDDVDDVVTP